MSLSQSRKQGMATSWPCHLQHATIRGETGGTPDRERKEWRRRSGEEGVERKVTVTGGGMVIGSRLCTWLVMMSQFKQ